MLPGATLFFISYCPFKVLHGVWKAFAFLSGRRLELFHQISGHSQAIKILMVALSHNHNYNLVMQTSPFLQLGLLQVNLWSRKGGRGNSGSLLTAASPYSYLLTWKELCWESEWRRVTSEKIFIHWYWLSSPLWTQQCLKCAHGQFCGPIIHATRGPSLTTPLPLLSVVWPA